ncbi:MAG: aspartyl/asparaginyl beta-hydroxylase domain-containing protein [Pseudomonadota bacterium]
MTAPELPFPPNAPGAQVVQWAGQELAKDNPDPVLALAEARLEILPRDLTANLLKGHALYVQGRIRTAVGFYRAAFNLAQSQLNEQAYCQQLLSLAQQVTQNAGQIFVQRLIDGMSSAGLHLGAEHKRIRDALAMMTGQAQRPATTERYPAQPSVLFIPGLPTTEFRTTDDLPWAEHLRQGIDAITEDLETMIAKQAAFEPYLQGSSLAPITVDHDAVNNDGWGALHLHKTGTPVEDHLKLCTETMKILEGLPIPKMRGKSPNILFSRLKPGMHIPPHHGQTNCRFIGHLPLITPEGAWLRVGSETRAHKRGEILLFDDSIEHEAKNESTEDRIVLIFDVWRPELSVEEQRLIAAFFDIVEAME